LKRHPTARRRVLFALAGLATLACSACRPSDRIPVVPVKGQLFYQGQPAVDALVIFHPVNNADPNAPRPTGRVGADGSFTLTTYDQDDGAPVGVYNIAVVWRLTPADAEDDDDGQGKVDQLQGQYGDPLTSGLRREVKEGSNELPAIMLDG
jgi:hypothetical protein